MKNLKFYLSLIVLCCFFCGCASIVPVTDRIIAEVGGEEQLQNFQYYISRDIVLNRQESETDAGIAKGQAKVVVTTQEDEINIMKSTPGLVIDHVYRADKNSYILSVSFEDGNENYLQFAHLGNPNSNSLYTLVTTSSDKSKLIYGSDEYVYSFPDRFQPLRKSKFFENVFKKSEVYGEVPCLLIKRNKKSIVKKSRRTVKGRRLEK